MHRIIANAEKAFNAIQQGAEGITIGLTGHVYTPNKDTGYCVSIGTSFTFQAENATALARRCLHHIRCLYPYFNANYARQGFVPCLGVWRNSAGLYEIDFTLIVDTWEQALCIGEAEQQAAIFALHTGQCINVDVAAVPAALA